MPLKLVYEDESGAYSGVRPDFLKKFTPVAINPNFEVYDSLDGSNRFIASKCSRVPYDDDLTIGRFGIDLFRAKPTLTEALEYGAMLPQSYRWNLTIAFAAQNEKEYSKKAAVWDSYNSFIWGNQPQTVWVAPHSGKFNRPPDEIVFNPKMWLDNFTAGVTALCAYKDNRKPKKRNVVYVHRTTSLGAVLNLGGLSILDEAKINTAAEKAERKYHKKVQYLADEFKDDFRQMISRLFKHLLDRRGTLNPDQLRNALDGHSVTMMLMARGLKSYGQEIKEFTPEEFEKALVNLGKIDMQVANTRLALMIKTGLTLKLPEKIQQGLLSSAVGIECAGTYLDRDPELVAEIILDVKKELFD
jgi:hypothetical protein